MIRGKTMPAPYIDRLTVERFGCVQELEMGLTPMHALIGPNDSGKSTLLRALRLAALAASPTAVAQQSSKGQLLYDLSMPEASTLGLQIVGAGPARLGYAVKGRAGSFQTQLSRLQGSEWVKAEDGSLVVGGELAAKHADFADALNAPVFLRLEPTAMRQPGGQILAHREIAFIDHRGTGLAAVLQAINSRDVDGFVRIRNRARELFPSLTTIRVPPIENNLVKLQAELDDGRIVEAGEMSDGVLYFLAYAAAQYLAPTRLMLIEEPENGLHPARIAEVVGMLRELSRTSQVVMATHSPLVINELQGEEVSIVTRNPQNGTRVRRLSETYNYAERSKVMANGELWLTYGSADSEQGLFTKPEPAA